MRCSRTCSRIRRSTCATSSSRASSRGARRGRPRLDRSRGRWLFCRSLPFTISRRTFHGMDWSLVQGPVRRELARVDRQLATLFRSPIGIINQVAGHFLATRGKKFRPTLLLLVARLTGKADRELISAACVVEIIHAAALIHDDSVDQSLLRRGLPTVNNLWTDELAIIIGDFRYSKAFTKMVDEELHPAMEILARVSHEMTIGEALEFEHANDLDVSEDEYLEVIRAKTATLIGGACQIGAAHNGGGEDKARHKRFYRFGEQIGMAFQIADDLFDFVGDP